METISYPASKRNKNCLVILMLFVKNCKNMLHAIYHKQMLLAHKLNICLDRHYSRHWRLKMERLGFLWIGFINAGQTYTFTITWLLTLNIWTRDEDKEKGKDRVGDIILLRLNNKTKSNIWRLRQECHKLRDSLGCTGRPSWKEKENKKNKVFYATFPKGVNLITTVNN